MTSSAALRSGRACGPTSVRGCAVDEGVTDVDDSSIYNGHMEWLMSLATVIVGGLLGYFANQRATEKQRTHDEKLHTQQRLNDEKVRVEEWQRADARRWDPERYAVYAQVWNESVSLISTLHALTPHWDDNEPPPPELLTAFEDQRDTVAAVHGRAMILASESVRTTLVPLWRTTLEVGNAMNQPSDSTEPGDDLVHRLGTEIGTLLGRFRAAAAEELGTDDALDKTPVQEGG